MFKDSARTAQTYIRKEKVKQRYVEYLTQCENVDHQALSAFVHSLAFDEKVSGLAFYANTIYTIIDDTSLSNPIRFGAWYNLFLSMLRLKNAPQIMAKMIEDYRSHLSEYAPYKIAAAMVLSK